MNDYTDTSAWTYGAEHELADWALSDLPKLNTQRYSGFKQDIRDYTIVNSNGIANDPKGKHYGYGGEINTPPSSCIAGQVEILTHIKKILPTATVNYRSNLHIHIRVPGLSSDLEALKQLQSFIHAQMPSILPIIRPLPEPAWENHLSSDSNQDFIVDYYKGALKRWKRCKISHWTLLKPTRLAVQLSSSGLSEFFNNEAPKALKTGLSMFHFQPRLCVNIRQLRETDTIEFRHFQGTLNEAELRSAFRWCKAFLDIALNGTSEDHPRNDNLFTLAGFYAPFLPPQLPYDHDLETKYQLTSHSGHLPIETVLKNIQAILKHKI